MHSSMWYRNRLNLSVAGGTSEYSAVMCFRDLSENAHKKIAILAHHGSSRYA